MNVDPALHRAALERFRTRRALTIRGWAGRAGVDESSLRQFLYGKPNRAPSPSMTYLSLARLAAAEGVTVAEMMGETLPRDAAMGTIAIPWLAMQAELDGRGIVGIDTGRAPYRLPRFACEEALLGEPARGHFFEQTTDALAPEIRKGDAVLIDIARVVPERDPGFYCVWNGVVPQLGLLTPLPDRQLRFMAETNTATMRDYDRDHLQIVGRAVWRSGAL